MKREPNAAELLLSGGVIAIACWAIVYLIWGGR